MHPPEKLWQWLWEGACVTPVIWGGGQDIEVQRRRHLQLAEMEGLVTTLLVTGLSSDLPSSTYLSFITCQALL